MKRQSVAIFALFAVICVAFGSQENCEEKINECKKKLLDVLQGDFTDNEACQEFRGVSECIRNVADECLDEEEVMDVEKILMKFEDVLDTYCMDEETKCIVDNEDYLRECVVDRGTDISELLQHESVPTGMDPKFVRCYLYGLMSHCVMGRAVEKCGTAGGETAAMLLSDMPLHVQESCDSQQVSVEDYVQELFSGQRKKRGLVDYRKKRAPQD